MTNVLKDKGYSACAMGSHKQNVPVSMQNASECLGSKHEILVRCSKFHCVSSLRQRKCMLFVKCASVVTGRVEGTLQFWCCHPMGMCVYSENLYCSHRASQSCPECKSHYRRNAPKKLFFGLTCGVAGLSFDIGGGGCAIELDLLLLNFESSGSDFLWLTLLSTGGMVEPNPFSFTATPESSGPSPRSGEVMTSLTSKLAFEALRDSWMLLFALDMADRRELFVAARIVPPFSSACRRSSRSMSPRMVVPPIARLSSGIGTNLTMPRSGVTLIESPRNCWISAALRLFVVGCNCTGNAVIVRMYVGSKEPPSSRQAEWLTVIIMDVSGRWYLVER
jgi:hypothetical protein